jgi:hypothetical protein
MAAIARLKGNRDEFTTKLLMIKVVGDRVAGEVHGKQEKWAGKKKERTQEKGGRYSLGLLPAGGTRAGRRVAGEMITRRLTYSSAS